MWHDLLPFRAAKAEYSTDGTTWTEDTTDIYRRTLTNQKENQTITVLSDSRPYARFTWDAESSIWHACQADWLVIGFAYASPAATCSIKFQYSKDGITWIDSLTVPSGSYNSEPSWFKISNDFSSCRAVRLILTRTNSSGTLNLSSVKWLTKRWGNQGFGSELEKPYSWDNNANLYYRNTSSTLGLSSAPWSAIYGTTIYENGTSLADKYALKTAIPTVNDGVLTLKASDGVTATQQTFTANDADNVTFEVKHATPTGAAAGSYGPSAGGEQTAKGTLDIIVPQITTDKFGHITGVTNKTFKVIDTDTDTHYTTGLYIGASNTKANAATSNGGTYIKLYDDNTKRSEFKISGSGATTVASDASGNLTITSTDNDTKNTAGSTNSDSKLFLIGATSQAANPQTYSDSEVYTTNGTLTTNKVQVGNGTATMQYDSATQCIRFVIV